MGSFFVGGSLDGDSEDIYIYILIFANLHTDNNYPIIFIFIYVNMYKLF